MSKSVTASELFAMRLPKTRGGEGLVGLLMVAMEALMSLQSGEGKSNQQVLDSEKGKKTVTMCSPTKTPGGQDLPFYHTFTTQPDTVSLYPDLRSLLKRICR